MVEHSPKILNSEEKATITTTIACIMVEYAPLLYFWGVSGLVGRKIVIFLCLLVLFFFSLSLFFSPFLGESVVTYCVSKGLRVVPVQLPSIRVIHHHHHHLSLNHKGCLGTTDDFTTSFLHYFLFSTAPWDLANSRPVHFLMLSSHLFHCLPCLLPPFTVPCKMVLARPDE